MDFTRQMTDSMRRYSIGNGNSTLAGYAGTSDTFRMSDNWQYVSDLFAQSPGGVNNSVDSVSALRVKFGLPLLQDAEPTNANEKQKMDEMDKQGNPINPDSTDPNAENAGLFDYLPSIPDLGIEKTFFDFVTKYGARIAVYLLGVVLLALGVILLLSKSETVRTVVAEGVKTAAKS